MSYLRQIDELIADGAPEGAVYYAIQAAVTDYGGRREKNKVVSTGETRYDAALEEAADAIEELNSQLDDFKRLCLPLKENRLYKYSDGSFVEVFLILQSEPPKEV